MGQMAGQVDAVDPGRVAHYRAQGWWRDGTILDDVDRAVARHPDKVAVVAHRAEGGVEVLSYRRLDRLADRFAGALLELGVRPGDPVSFQLPNWWEFVALFLGCARIGAVTNAIVPILRRREVGFILERVGSRVCIAPASFRGFDHAAMLAEIRRSCPTLEHVFVIGGDGPPGTRSFEEFFVEPRRESRALRAELDARRPSGDDLAQIQFTSGTTGEPKGVLHSFNTLEVGVRAVCDPLGLDEDDVVLMFSPMGHQTGFLYGMCMPLRLGMKTVLQDVWDPRVMLRLVEDEGVTWTMGSTTFVLDACAAAAGAGADLSTLRFFTCGGAPIPPTAVTEARERLGVPLVAVWGMTENAVCTITLPSDPDTTVASSDGTPLPWVELRVVDTEWQDALSGEEGYLVVRGPSQHLGYFDRPDLYAASFHDGWFDTGDLARRFADGYIRISGRSKDLIIRGGENIPVTEVESALYRHPGVLEVAVVACPDERLGERACAVVVPAETGAPTLDELRAHLDAEGMARQFWPERLEVRDALPKTPAGKIQKFLLRQEIAAAAVTEPVG